MLFELVVLVFGDLHLRDLCLEGLHLVFELSDSCAAISASTWEDGGCRPSNRYDRGEQNLCWRLAAVLHQVG